MAPSFFWVQIPKAWHSRLCEISTVLLLFVPLWGKDVGPGSDQSYTTLLCDFGQDVDHLQFSVSPSVRFRHGIYEAMRVSNHRASQLLSSGISPFKCPFNTSLRTSNYGLAL